MSNETEQQAQEPNKPSYESTWYIEVRLAVRRPDPERFAAWVATQCREMLDPSTDERMLSVQAYAVDDRAKY